MTTWLITVSGDDQPEQLHKFCETIALMEGVFLDTQHTVLAGRMSAMYKVCLPETYISFALKMIDEYTQRGLDILVRDLPDEFQEPTAGYLVVDIQGQYRFGIDHEIRVIMECHGAIVEQLNQQFSSTTLVGEHRYRVSIRAGLLRRISEPDLLKALHRLSPAINVRLSVLDPADRLVG